MNKDNPKFAIKKLLKIKLIAPVLLAGMLVITGFSGDNYFEISKNLDIFSSLYRELHVFYVDETKPGELMKIGIDAMLKSLDPYTNFIPESQIEDYRFMTTGQYGGIGALIRTRNNKVIVAEPYEGFPAQKSGLRAGDVIVAVDGKTTADKTTEQMSEVLKGQPGTSLNIKVERPGIPGTLDFELVREEVKIQDVPYAGYVAPGIGYIKLTSFTETASREVKKALLNLKETDTLKALILDLRDNGGGLLMEAVNISNFFVEKGQDIVSTKGKIKEWDRTHKTLNPPLDKEIPLAILINGNAASASEIVSGAIQDLDRGIIIGNKSYGKGLVQQTRDLSYNAKLKVTVAKYYIPSGRCIQKLDYSHRDENGTVTAVPDSLMKTFLTKNGRLVKDGGGIYPDILVKDPEITPITITLLEQDLLFDYATEFRTKHDTIEEAANFRIKEKAYEDFVSWLNNREFEYQTSCEELLEDLKEVAEDEKYYERIHEEYQALKKALHQTKEQDLEKNADDISYFLENEIVSRYFYQKGRVVNSLSKDPYVKEAIHYLQDIPAYKQILAGTSPNGNITLPGNNN